MPFLANDGSRYLENGEITNFFRSKILLSDIDEIEWQIFSNCRTWKSFRLANKVQGFHEHFQSSLCTDILAPKGYKPNMQVQKKYVILLYEKGSFFVRQFRVQIFCTYVLGFFGARTPAQKSHVKCW
jgi:hypothetical protein